MKPLLYTHAYCLLYKKSFGRKPYAFARRHARAVYSHTLGQLLQSLITCTGDSCIRKRSSFMPEIQREFANHVEGLVIIRLKRKRFLIFLDMARGLLCINVFNVSLRTVKNKIYLQNLFTDDYGVCPFRPFSRLLVTEWSPCFRPKYVEVRHLGRSGRF